jgi:hypothetical protein
LPDNCSLVKIVAKVINEHVIDIISPMTVWARINEST